MLVSKDGMHIFEIRFPGTSLDYPEEESRPLVHIILHLLEAQFTDAVIALNFFEREQARAFDNLQERAQAGVSEEEEELTQALEGYRKELGDEAFFQMYPAILDAIELEMRKQRWESGWESGKVPQEYQTHLPFIFAHAYVYALDSFQKILKRLVHEPGVPHAVDEALERFKTAFPVLKGVRDSAHHIEDRGRGLDRHGKPLDLKPLYNRIAYAPSGGVLLLSILRGNNLGYTLEDGSYGEIAVSRENTEEVAAIFQVVIDAFPWKGRPRQITC